MTMPTEDLRDRAFCLGCGYALRGLVETRCPECGRAFDPRDPMTMRVPGIVIRPPPKPFPFAPGIILWAAPTAALSAIGMIAALWYPVAVGSLAWFGILAAWRRRNRREHAAAARGEPLPGTRMWRPVVGVLLAISLLSGIGYHRCPHGRYYRYGPVSVFQGIPGGGGPCRNYVRRGTRFEMVRSWYLIVS
jgi:hypothetical protein